MSCLCLSHCLPHCQSHCSSSNHKSLNFAAHRTTPARADTVQCFYSVEPLLLYEQGVTTVFGAARKWFDDRHQFLASHWSMNTVSNTVRPLYFSDETHCILWRSLHEMACRRLQLRIHVVPTGASRHTNLAKGVVSVLSTYPYSRHGSNCASARAATCQAS